MEQDVKRIDTRATLLRYIEENPGIHYRGLLRVTHIANGVLSYHLAALEKLHKIQVNRQSKMTHYYPLSVSDKESAILRFVRKESIRQILLFILERDRCTFKEIVEHSRRSPSTVSIQLKQLKEAGIVSIRRGEYHLYRLTERDLVAEVLSKYKPSFADKVVDNYAEVMEEL